MLKKFRQISEGYFKAFVESLGMLDQVTKDMAIKRLFKCYDCPIRDGSYCSSGKTAPDVNGKNVNGCGCVIEVAALVEDKECPRGLW